MLILAVFPFPIGYYTLLRFVVTISAGLLCWYYYREGEYLFLIIFGMVGLIFNPIIQVYLHNKHIWIPIDIIAGILFIYQALKFPILQSKRDELR
jgi:hypothetical protein